MSIFMHSRAPAFTARKGHVDPHRSSRDGRRRRRPLARLPIALLRANQPTAASDLRPDGSRLRP
jgi:hypothetical protein